MQTTADKLEAELIQLSARMNAAEYQMLTRIRELEDVIALEDWTYPQWIAWRLNLPNKTAYERVRVARCLASLPLISGAFEDGRLSYSKVRVITRMAKPETDAAYLANALVMSVHQLEVLTAKHRKFSTEESDKHVRDRFVQLVQDDDGMFTLRGRLAPDDAAILLKALSAADPQQAKVDALIQVATAAIDRLATGDDARLHVEHNLVDGVPVSDAAAERLCCQNPHKRTISVSQRRVLMRRHGGTCAFPGCTHRRFLDGHHVVHWARGGTTTVKNLTLLCTKHHRLLHEGRFTIDNDGKVYNQHGIPITNPSVKADFSLPRAATLRPPVWNGDHTRWDDALNVFLRADHREPPIHTVTGFAG